MLQLIYDIRIKTSTGEVLFFDYCHSVEVERSYTTLTNTAKLILPKKIKNLRLADAIKVGNEVVIKVGYNTELVKEFSGFVSAVKATVPIEIECQDAMWLLKQITVTKSYRQVRLAELIADIVPNTIVVNVTDCDLGAFRISKTTVAKVLEHLQKEYGIYSFIKNDVLHVGLGLTSLLNSSSNSNVESFGFQKNIVKNSLEYKTEADTKIRVKAISIQPNGTKLEVDDIGDVEGEQHTLHYYGLTEIALRKIAEAQLPILKYTGYKGSFETFGFPTVDMGDVVELKDDEYAERTGKFLVEKVIVKSGIGGYRRSIYLGTKK